jgi:hypothetical protein
VAVLLTHASGRGAPEPNTLRHQELRGKVYQEHRQRDSWLISTSYCDENKEEVRTRRGKLHVLRDDEDLNLGTTIIVAQRW